jgi:NTP pyrophosphatase (non-canonical NTP hydrolase)
MEYNKIIELGHLDGLSSFLHETAVEKGFWNNEVDVNFVLSKLALVHSEVSEVLEAVRKSMGEEVVVEEMADIIIRLLDLYAGMVDAGMVETSIDDALAKKIEKNKSRPHMHGVLA